MNGEVRYVHSQQDTSTPNVEHSSERERDGERERDWLFYEPKPFIQLFLLNQVSKIVYHKLKVNDNRPTQNQVGT